MNIGNDIRLMRLKHWVKDVFVLAPLIFSLSFDKPTCILKTALMCLVFGLASSVVYIINDIIDRNNDRHHPKKRNRPIAGGQISVQHALVLAVVLVVFALGFSLSLNLASMVVIISYIGINIAYSLYLKKQAFIEVMIIAAGFLLRIIAGAVVIDVPLSRWMLLTTFFLALFLGFGKRRKEMIAVTNCAEHRSVLEQYSVELLNCLIIISASLTIITYSLYVVISQNVERLGSNGFITTIPLVVFGVFRYLYLVYRENAGGDPAELLLRDRPLIADIVLWMITVSILLGVSMLCEVST